MPQAQAASMNCARAATATEHAICATPSLAELDRELAEAYTRRLAAHGPSDAQAGNAVRQAQRAWLKARNRCGSDVSCLRGAYEERTAELKTFAAQADVYQPDEIDRLAADDLRAAIAAQRQKGPELPLETALEAFRIPPAQVTRFASDSGLERTTASLLPAQRPAGVSEDEWRALRASRIEVDAEGGNVSYTLVDLDGDGQRDLIVDAYAGGTGLFSYVSTLRRVGDAFQAAGGKRSEGVDNAYVYSLNGRGANQDGTWIRLRDRTYAAYRVGYYGVDTVYLLRALQPVGDVPAVTVHYDYDLQLPRVQARDDGSAPVTLSNRLHRDLMAALPNVRLAQGERPTAGNPPLCPIPAGTPEDERAAYQGLGPGHYTFEIVADFPVYLDGVCHLGRLIDQFGAYYTEEGGLLAQYQVARPGTDESTTYEVRGKRRATDVSTSVTAVQGDNGM